MAASESSSFSVSLNSFHMKNNIMRYIGSEENVFAQKQNKKKHFKIQLGEKNLPFHDVLYHFVFLYFSTARLVAFALHNKDDDDGQGI